MTLWILVEGQTEEDFAWDVLVPHLQNFEIEVKVTVVGVALSKRKNRRTGAGSKLGGGSFSTWKRDFDRILKGNSGNQFRMTTLFDLYGLPSDFPGLDQLEGQLDTKLRCEALEIKLKERVDDWRLIPYLQLHEFEALVLACLPELLAQLDAKDQLEGFEKLRSEIQGLQPEDINDGPETAPSKRLMAHIPGYRKPLHGPQALRSAGLAVIREKCPRFDGWLTQLENLKGPLNN